MELYYVLPVVFLPSINTSRSSFREKSKRNASTILNLNHHISHGLLSPCKEHWLDIKFAINIYTQADIVS